MRIDGNAPVPPPLPLARAREEGAEGSGVRAYTILALTGLMGMALALMENDRDLVWILFLGTVGAIGVIARWRFGPPLVLLGLAVLELVHAAVNPWRGAYGPDESVFLDAVLAASALAYVAGHYRLLSLAQTVFPIDPRRPPPRPDGGKPPPPGQRRSPDLPGPWELPTLAVMAGVWAVGASLLWLALGTAEAPDAMLRGLDRRERLRAVGLWHGLLLIFLVGLTAAVLAAAAAYLRWATARPEEHRMFLQDQAWRETRREQNRFNRFLTWARLRARRRKEQS